MLLFLRFISMLVFVVFAVRFYIKLKRFQKAFSNNLFVLSLQEKTTVLTILLIKMFLERLLQKNV